MTRYKLWYEKFPVNVLMWFVMIGVRVWIGSAKVIGWLQGKRP